VLIVSATVEASNFKFGTPLWFGSILPKTTFRAKIGGFGARSAPQKFGNSYLFLQLLKLTTSSFVHNLDLGKLPIIIIIIIIIIFI